MTTERRNWTENEITLALALYMQMPYGRISTSYEPVRRLAAVLGRKPGAVSFKLANLAALDSRVAASGRKGFEHPACAFPGCKLGVKHARLAEAY